jgi:hypothetical protein
MLLLLMMMMMMLLLLLLVAAAAAADAAAAAACMLAAAAAAARNSRNFFQKQLLPLRSLRWNQMSYTLNVYEVRGLKASKEQVRPAHISDAVPAQMTKFLGLCQNKMENVEFERRRAQVTRVDRGECSV